MTDVVTSPLPVHLLAPYVAAGAREVRAGKEMRPAWAAAVGETIRQLRLEQAATGGPSAIDPGQAAALVASGGRSFQLAALALEASDEQATTASAQSNAAGDRLGRIIESLEGVQRGDSESAAQVDRLFDVITERLLAASDDDLS